MLLYKDEAFEDRWTTVPSLTLDDDIYVKVFMVKNQTASYPGDLCHMQTPQCAAARFKVSLYLARAGAALSHALSNILWTIPQATQHSPTREPKVARVLCETPATPVVYPQCGGDEMNNTACCVFV